MDLRQYEIFIINLDPTTGSEIRKTRPCVIISPNEMNKYLRNVTIAPITSKSHDYPTRVKIKLSERSNWVVLDQIRTIEKTRIVKKINKLSQQEIMKCKAVIKQMFVD
jgi:mRNA interferase MazF